VGGIFFSLLNALQDILFSPHFSAGFFFLESVVFTFTESVYIYIVVIAEIVLIWSCKAFKWHRLGNLKFGDPKYSVENVNHHSPWACLHSPHWG